MLSEIRFVVAMWFSAGTVERKWLPKVSVSSQTDQNYRRGITTFRRRISSGSRTTKTCTA